MTASDDSVMPAVTVPKRRGRPPKNPQIVGAKETVATHETVPADKKFYQIHFVEDGLTTLGKVWYRGEELTVVEGTDEWDKVHDKNGNTFLTLDEDAQIDKWGKRMFRPGPWKGKGLDIDNPELTEQERAILERAEKKRLQAASLT